MYDVFLRFPEYKTKAVTFSYDDGVEQDERLIEIFNRNGLKSAFNINTGLIAPEGTIYPSDQLHRRLGYRAIQRIYSAGGHELAMHSLHHKYMDSLNECDLLYELAADKANLEKLTGKIIRGFACPYGRSNAKLKSALAQLNVVYSRGVQCSMDFSLPQDFLDITPTCRHSSEGLDRLIEHFCTDSPLDSYHDRHPWLFYMWGHSYEFDRDNCWSLIEDVAKKIGMRSDTWYADNITIFSYISDYRRLIYSAAGDLVFNPTSSRIWLESDREKFYIEPGETRPVHRLPAEEFVYQEK